MGIVANAVSYAPGAFPAARARPRRFASFAELTAVASRGFLPKKVYAPAAFAAVWSRRGQPQEGRHGTRARRCDRSVPAKPDGPARRRRGRRPARPAVRGRARRGGVRGDPPAARPHGHGRLPAAAARPPRGRGRLPGRVPRLPAQGRLAAPARPTRQLAARRRPTRGRQGRGGRRPPTGQGETLGQRAGTRRDRPRRGRRTPPPARRRRRPAAGQVPGAGGALLPRRQDLRRGRPGAGVGRGDRVGTAVPRPRPPAPPAGELRRRPLGRPPRPAPARSGPKRAGEIADGGRGGPRRDRRRFPEGRRPGGRSGERDVLDKIADRVGDGPDACRRGRRRRGGGLRQGAGARRPEAARAGRPGREGDPEGARPGRRRLDPARLQAVRARRCFPSRSKRPSCGSTSTGPAGR